MFRPGRESGRVRLWQKESKEALCLRAGFLSQVQSTGALRPMREAK